MMTPSLADLSAENGRLRREIERLRMEREILKNRHHLRGGCKMKFNFVQQHRSAWPIRMMCHVLGISSSGYYAWAGRAESKRSAANRQLLEDIRRIHIASSGTYGSPRVHAVLHRSGQKVGRTRIETLMRVPAFSG